MARDVYSSDTQPADTPEAKYDGPDRDYRPSMFQIREDTPGAVAAEMRPGIYPRDSKRHPHP